MLRSSQFPKILIQEPRHLPLLPFDLLAREYVIMAVVILPTKFNSTYLPPLRYPQADEKTLRP